MRFAPVTRIAVLVAVLACPLVAASGQGSPTPAGPAKSPEAVTPAPETAVISDRIYNAASTPLAIEWRDMSTELQEKFGRKTRLGLANKSGQRIVRYDIGCVTENEGRVKVLNTLFWVAVTEGGTGPGHFSAGLFDHQDPSKDEQWANRMCKGGRLSVVLVGFADGSLWLAQGTPWIESKKN